MSVLERTMIDPEIEAAIAAAIRRDPGKWEEADEPFCTDLAPPAGATKSTSNPADDQATRLRALIQGETASMPLRGAGIKLSSVIPVNQQHPVGGPDARPTQDTSSTDVHGKLPTMIAVASGKGGVGKTNIAVNLAITLAARGSRVTLLDADLGTANADLLCGITPTARLEHVISSLPVHDGARRSVREIAVDMPAMAGGVAGAARARLIAGSSGVGRLADLSATQQRQLLASLSELDDDTDVLVVDTSAGVSRAVTSFVAAADLTVVVTTPEPTAITDAYALIKCASAGEDSFSGGTGVPPVHERWSQTAQAGCLCHERPSHGSPSFSLIVNQVSGEDEARRVHARLAAVCDRFLGVALPMLGWVAHDLRLPEAVRARQPLVVRTPRSPAARDIQMIGGKLAQQIGLDASAERTRGGGRNGVGGIAGALARVLRFSGR